MRITLRFYVASVTELAGGQHNVRLQPDYKDGANKDWAKFTPAGSIELSLSQEAAVEFYVDAMRERKSIHITMEAIKPE